MVYLACILWLSAVCCGLGRAWRYETAAGVAAQPPSEWPANSKIRLYSGQPTLVIAAHPQCPCTRAAIGELALRCLAVRIKFRPMCCSIKPIGSPDGWKKTDLWRTAAAIPGVHVLSDERGIEAQRFHAVTSGQATLYDKNGHVVFSGGITSSRGHSGENNGRISSVALLNREHPIYTHTPVFGCSLLGTATKEIKNR